VGPKPEPELEPSPRLEVVRITPVRGSRSDGCSRYSSARSGACTPKFGGWRFALFPFVIALLTVGATVALVETGTAPGTIVSGLHVPPSPSDSLQRHRRLRRLRHARERLRTALLTALLVDDAAALAAAVCCAFLLKDALFYASRSCSPMALGSAALTDCRPRRRSMSGCSGSRSSSSSPSEWPSPSR